MSKAEISCPICKSNIPENEINTDKETFFCMYCKKEFFVSHILSANELKTIEEKLSNPPKHIKVKKRSDNITVKIYTHRLTPLVVFAFIFLWVTIFSFIVGYGTQIFRKELNTSNLIGTTAWIIFAIVSIFLIYTSFYSAFGRFELKYGFKNYIFNGFWFIGRKQPIDWAKINNFLLFTYVNEGGEDKIRTDYLLIKYAQDKEIKFSLSYLNEQKIDFLFSIIKYFRYKEIIKTAEKKRLKFVEIEP